MRFAGNHQTDLMRVGIVICGLYAGLGMVFFMNREMRMHNGVMPVFVHVKLRRLHEPEHECQHGKEGGRNAHVSHSASYRKRESIKQAID